MARNAILTLCSAGLLLLVACGGQGEPEKQEAAETANELEAAADKAVDPAQAEVLQNQADALKEVAEGDEEEVEGAVKVTGQ
jgi:hypothetical protein